MSDHWNTPDAKWLVVEVAFSGVRVLGGKCKFQSGKVVFAGSKSEAADYIIENELNAKNVAVIGAVLECGENGTIQGGALSVMTGGNYAKMTGGNSAVMTGGDAAKMTGGYYAVMNFQYYDGRRTRIVTAYVGEDGIEPNVAYKLDAKDKVVPA